MAEVRADLANCSGLPRLHLVYRVRSSNGEEPVGGWAVDLNLGTHAALLPLLLPEATGHHQAPLHHHHGEVGPGLQHVRHPVPLQPGVRPLARGEALHGPQPLRPIVAAQHVDPALQHGGPGGGGEGGGDQLLAAGALGHHVGEVSPFVGCRVVARNRRQHLCAVEAADGVDALHEGGGGEVGPDLAHVRKLVPLVGHCRGVKGVGSPGS